MISAKILRLAMAEIEECLSPAKFLGNEGRDKVCCTSLSSKRLKIFKGLFKASLLLNSL